MASGWQHLGPYGAAISPTGREPDRPYLGRKPLQKLTRLDVEAWHTTLRNGGLAARTIGHAHRVLSKALSDAESDGLVVRNVCKLQRAPKVAESEMAIVQDVPAFVGLSSAARAYTSPPWWRCSPACAWARCWRCAGARVDLDGKVIRCARRWSRPRRTAFASRRQSRKPAAAISPCRISLVDALREHRKDVLEIADEARRRASLPDDALLFANLEGGPLRPSTVSSDWGELAERIGMPEVTFHALRHTHASQLIASGVDIVTISKRLGTPSRASRLRSMPTCFIRTTARLRRPSTRLWNR